MELGVGLLLMVGLFARCAALALFFYTLALALIFHAYWAAPAAQARMQASFFFGHLSMMGGMLMVVAFGAGALQSCDARSCIRGAVGRLRRYAPRKTA